VERQPAVYILTNRNNQVLYTGVTADLVKRVWEHREALDPTAFTARYRVHKLVHFETASTMVEAIQREKQIKGWLRRKKVALIESHNPGWLDRWNEIVNGGPEAKPGRYVSG
jgi:putative endonuclease